MKQRLLVQTQLSNYSDKGKYILEADSGWQMTINRCREMLKLNSELHIDIMGPLTDSDNDRNQCITHPFDINPDLWEKYGEDGEKRLRYIEHRIIPNAVVTRYDFDWTSLAIALDLGMHKIGGAPKYDVMYVNDPMHLRNFKAMFHVVGGYQPKFAVHSHFIDNPSCPKFPKEASLWFGQCEAAIRADVNFWQCESAMKVFFYEMREFFTPPVVEYTKEKSVPWDDGYSIEEITSEINMSNIRFDMKKLDKLMIEENKTVVFVPNRVGGRGRSSDYTNCGKFMFELLPEIRKKRQDFIVIAGNPSQKFSNSELEAECGKNGYVNLVPDALNRDEYKYVAKIADIAVSLYGLDGDAYGGTATRECIEHSCAPLWLDCHEYSHLARAVGYESYLAKPDFSDFVDKTTELLKLIDEDNCLQLNKHVQDLKTVIRNKCSFEATTPAAMGRMGLLK